MNRETFEKWLNRNLACQPAMIWWSSLPKNKQDLESVWKICPNGYWLLWLHEKTVGEYSPEVEKVFFEAFDRATRIVVDKLEEEKYVASSNAIKKHIPISSMKDVESVVQLISVVVSINYHHLFSYLHFMHKDVLEDYPSFASTCTAFFKNHEERKEELFRIAEDCRRFLNLLDISHYMR